MNRHTPSQHTRRSLMRPKSAVSSAYLMRKTTRPALNIHTLVPAVQHPTPQVSQRRASVTASTSPRAVGPIALHARPSPACRRLWGWLVTSNSRQCASPAPRR
eukprot:823466-Rhodomonas_salina.1